MINSCVPKHNGLHRMINCQVMHVLSAVLGCSCTPVLLMYVCLYWLLLNVNSACPGGCLFITAFNNVDFVILAIAAASATTAAIVTTTKSNNNNNNKTVCPCKAQVLHTAINFQGQRSRSHVPTFIRLTQSSKIHYRIKLHQNLTSNFQVIGNFLIQEVQK